MISAFSAITQAQAGRKQQASPMDQQQDSGGGGGMPELEYAPRERKPRVKREGTMRSRAAAGQDSLYKKTFKL